MQVGKWTKSVSSPVCVCFVLHDAAVSLNSPARFHRSLLLAETSDGLIEKNRASHTGEHGGIVQLPYVC